MKILALYRIGGSWSFDVRRNDGGVCNMEVGRAFADVARLMAHMQDLDMERADWKKAAGGEG